MIKEDFIDFLTSKETLSKFKTTDKGRRFRKATPIQVAAVILCVLKNKQDGKYYYGDRSNAVMTHRVVHKLLCSPDKYKETDIELTGKDSELTEDTIYSILRHFKFFDPNKTKERYVYRGGHFYTSEMGKHYNNWRASEEKLCSYIGWNDNIYEEDINEIKSSVGEINEKVDEINEKVDEINEKVDEIKSYIMDDNEIYTKKMEVLNNISTSSEDKLTEWENYFKKVLDNPSISKGSKQSAEAVIKSINEKREKENDKRINKN